MTKALKYGQVIAVHLIAKYFPTNIGPDLVMLIPVAVEDLFPLVRTLTKLEVMTNNII